MDPVMANRIAGLAKRKPFHVRESHQARGRPQEPAVCLECGAVLQQGRWQWLPRPEGAQIAICPACHSSWT